jgi:hypothetical protein
MQDIQFPLGCDDDTMPPHSAMAQWSDYMIKACIALDRRIDEASNHKRRMEAAGFVDVVEVVQKWPQNAWAKDKELKEIGIWTMMNMLQGLHGLTMAPLTRGLGWSMEEVEAFLVNVRKDVKDRRVHCYWPMLVFILPAALFFLKLFFFIHPLPDHFFIATTNSQDPISYYVYGRKPEDAA